MLNDKKRYWIYNGITNTLSCRIGIEHEKVALSDP